MSRVSTYLNFSRNTEEAFKFYQSIFGGEFIDGVMRFRDVPSPEGAPAMNEADLDLIMHIELAILGGHVIMGTDAPESMGFSLNFGNNSHIMLEPDSREEATKLFNLLSKDGTVTQPLMDMFWGSFYGSFTDKYGIQWMVNCQNK